MTVYEVTMQPELIVIACMLLGAVMGFIIGRRIERNGHMKAPIGTLVIDRYNNETIPDLYLQLTANVESFEQEDEVRLKIVAHRAAENRSRR